ncbi:hypothetical protein GCM10007423_08910 [Dyadobacter endophyticus]|uniref:Peptidase S74 domain-containing protein n=2 Tax=Dyadobacter endophyticus TaxID=1749036 RepID=A0ABQ1YGX9_9BACT|nr:hypothetical protein GCM10007423_08910 [Dyadobacter endophyticus]
MLEVTGGTGNNKGLLAPRLTTAQRDAIVNPATALMIYNTTTNQLQVNTGTPAAPIWTSSSVSNAWNIAGNAGTNPATNYVGTSDAQPLVLRTNASERVRITEAGNVGINNGAPLAPLSFANALGTKVSFFDGGTTVDFLGIGVSPTQLNYHTATNSSHVFWAGGKNGDGTELVRIQGGGNVGIGTNAPSTKLHVNGTARITGSTGTPTTIVGRDGSGNIGSITLGAGLSIVGGALSASGGSSGWSLTGNAGINPATNYIGTTDAQPLLLRTNAAERFRITPTGNIGIGNAAPLVPLAFASVVGAKLSFFDSGANDQVGFGVSSNQFNYHTVPGADHVFFAGGRNGDGTELFRMKGNGNVGIGTNTPSAKLDVNGTARIAGSAGTATAITGRDGTGNISNITLGANLSLAGGVLSASGGGATGWGLTGNAATNPAINYLGTSDAQPLVMRTNAAERMRVTETGNVGIGTATPTAKLDIQSGNVNFSAEYGLNWDGGNSARIYMYPGLGLPGNNLFMESGENMIFISDLNGTAPGTNNRGFIWATNASWLNGGTPTERMRLTNSGRLGLGTTNPSYTLDVAGDINASASVRANGVVLTSDARLKRNILGTKHGLSTIMALNPVEYEKKQTIKDSIYDHHEIGFVAQEIAKVLPSLVKEGNDADKTLAVSYTELIPVLTKAIQEQQAQIESLKAANKELKDGQAVTAQLVERVKQMEQMLGVKGAEGISRAVSK